MQSHVHVLVYTPVQSKIDRVDSDQIVLWPGSHVNLADQLTHKTLEYVLHPVRVRGAQAANRMIHLNKKMEDNGMLSGGETVLEITHNQDLNHLLIESTQTIQINTRRNKERDDITDPYRRQHIAVAAGQVET